MHKYRTAWFMWIIAVSFFSFQYVLRLFPGLVIPELMRKFQIDATAFGILSAAYYFGYAGFQIPVGILLDRYSPRYVIAGSALLCCIGTLSFVYSDYWALTIFGRFLIGAGSAAGFLGTAKTVRMAFPEKYFGAMIGLTFTFGLFGALYGGKPVSLLIDHLGWTQVLNLLALFSLILAIAAFVLFPKEQQREKSGLKKVESEVQIFKSLTTIFANRKIVWIGLAGGLLVGPLEGFADVWGVSYLIKAYGLSKADASLVASGIYIGMLFGGPILSFIAEKLDSYYSVTAFCGFFMAIVFSVLLGTDLFSSKTILMSVMTFTGVLCCYQVVVFAIVCRIAPPHLSGLATSVTNCLNMSAGCLFHCIMGLIMDHKWSGILENGIKAYDAESYTSAISVIPITLFLGFIGFLFLNEKKTVTPQPTES